MGDHVGTALLLAGLAFMAIPVDDLTPVRATFIIFAGAAAGVAALRAVRTALGGAWSAGSSPSATIETQEDDDPLPANDLGAGRPASAPGSTADGDTDGDLGTTVVDPVEDKTEKRSVVYTRKVLLSVIAACIAIVVYTDATMAPERRFLTLVAGAMVGGLLAAAVEHGKWRARILGPIAAGAAFVGWRRLDKLGSASAVQPTSAATTAGCTSAAIVVVALGLATIEAIDPKATSGLAGKWATSRFVLTENTALSIHDHDPIDPQRWSIAQAADCDLERCDLWVDVANGEHFAMRRTSHLTWTGSHPDRGDCVNDNGRPVEPDGYRGTAHVTVADTDPQSRTIKIVIRERSRATRAAKAKGCNDPSFAEYEATATRQ